LKPGNYIGGHTATVKVVHEGRELDVDTGFIVFNRGNYPSFSKLIDALGVKSKPTRMSFSVRCDRTGLEYGGGSFNALFAQRRNLLRPSFLKMLRDIVRFGKEAPSQLVDGQVTVGEFLTRHGYSKEFGEHYLVPMAAALWSASESRAREIPIRFLVRFFENHGMLSPRSAPMWEVIEGGSRRYVDRVLEGIDPKRIRVGVAVESVERRGSGVQVRTRMGTQDFDEVILGTHSDQALSLLADASEEERAVLGAIAYQANDVVLHTDASVLPRSTRAWSAWNYHLTRERSERATVTYHMGILQGLDTQTPLCVTLNGTVQPSKVMGRYVYHHPVFSVESDLARERWFQISGVTRTHFCGAYWGNGFHEDGVRSALQVCKAFGETL
jgi:predicted NAD/FAD-binding protein